MNQQLQLLLLLAMIIGISKCAGHACRRWLRLPAAFGEILAGLLLGPSLINLLSWPIFRQADAAAWRMPDLVQALASLGVLLLMFIVGLETRLDRLVSVGKTAFWTAVNGVVLPLGSGVLCAWLFGYPLLEALFIGAVLTATSVTITAQTLKELGCLQTRESVTILGAAVIDDVLGIVVVAFVIAFSQIHGASSHARLADSLTTAIAHGLHVPLAPVQLVVILLLIAAFFALALLFGARGFAPLLGRVERWHAAFPVTAVALVSVFLFAFAAEYFGQVAAITGAYLAGVFIGRTHLGEAISRELHPMTYALFVPVFFISIGLGVNARSLAGGDIVFVIMISLVALLSKVIGCGLGARLTGFSSHEAVRVGVGMISRGEVGLIVAALGIESGVITAPVYAALVIMVLVSTVVTPLLLRLAFPRTPEILTPEYETIVEVDEAGE